MRYYVYMIRVGSFTKVGFSKNVEARLKQMQTGSPHKLKVTSRFPCQSRAEAMQLEREIHERCWKAHHRGEWFHTSGLTKALTAQVNGYKVRFGAKDAKWKAMTYAG